MGNRRKPIFLIKSLKSWLFNLIFYYCVTLYYSGPLFFCYLIPEYLLAGSIPPGIFILVKIYTPQFAILLLAHLGRKYKGRRIGFPDTTLMLISFFYKDFYQVAQSLFEEEFANLRLDNLARWDYGSYIQIPNALSAWSLYSNFDYLRCNPDRESVYPIETKILELLAEKAKDEFSDQVRALREKQEYIPRH